MVPCHGDGGLLVYVSFSMPVTSFSGNIGSAERVLYVAARFGFCWSTFWKFGGEIQVIFRYQRIC